MRVRARLARACVYAFTYISIYYFFYRKIRFTYVKFIFIILSNNVNIISFILKARSDNVLRKYRTRIQSPISERVYHDVFLLRFPHGLKACLPVQVVCKVDFLNGQRYLSASTALEQVDHLQQKLFPDSTAPEGCFDRHGQFGNTVRHMTVTFHTAAPMEPSLDGTYQVPW